MTKKRNNEGFSADAFFQTLFQNSPDAALVTRVCDGTILHANDEFSRITGYVHEEVIGKTTLDLNLYLNPEDRNHFLGQMSKDGVLEPQYAELRKRDGSIYKTFVSAHTFWSENCEYVCCSIRDISEQLRKEQEQIQRDEKLQRLFDTMAQGIVYQDADGMIVSVNPASERMLGMSEKQMKERSATVPAWRTISEDGSPLPEGEYPSMIALRTGKPFGPFTLGFSMKYSRNIFGFQFLRHRCSMKEKTSPTRSILS